MEFNNLENIDIENSVLYIITDTINNGRGNITVFEKYTGRTIFESNHPSHRHHLIKKRIKMQLISSGEDFIKYLRETQVE
mgnify:FL=1